MDQITVSIYVPVFNHENYIVRALESIRMQKTEYTYEVLIGEDCSTDNTRQVLQAWEKANPDDRFVYFYRQQNMHKSECNNIQDLKKRCKGKYMICLEGDDFWTDENKLQTQVTFLEENPEYYAVAHNCTVVGEDGEPNGETYPECKDAEYTFRHFANDILPGQAATFLFRNNMTDENFDLSLTRKRAGPADRNLYFSVLCHGRIHCIQKTMSAYRHITTGGSSFSATHKYRYDVEEHANRCRLEYVHETGTKEALLYVEYLYCRNIRYALRTGQISMQQAWQDLKHVRHKLRCLLMLLKRDINLRIFHKTMSV